MSWERGRDTNGKWAKVVKKREVLKAHKYMEESQIHLSFKHFKWNSFFILFISPCYQLSQIYFLVLGDEVPGVRATILYKPTLTLLMWPGVLRREPVHVFWKVLWHDTSRTSKHSPPTVPPASLSEYCHIASGCEGWEKPPVNESGGFVGGHGDIWPQVLCLFILKVAVKMMQRKNCARTCVAIPLLL